MLHGTPTTEVRVPRGRLKATIDWFALESKNSEDTLVYCE